MIKIAFSSILFFLFFMGCSSEESKWNEAKKTNSITSIEKYINEHPNGKYTNQAKELIAEINWAEVQKNISIENLYNYKKKYPKSKHLKEIEYIIEKIEFDSLVILKNSSLLKDWKKNHPISLFNVKIDSVLNEWLKPNGKEKVSVYISEKDYEENRLMRWNGNYYEMPGELSLIVDVVRGKTKNTICIKRGMSKDIIIELARKNDIYIDKAKMNVNGRVELVFSNNKLNGLKLKGGSQMGGYFMGQFEE